MINRRNIESSMIPHSTMDDIRGDIEGAVDQVPYGAVNTLWLALVKLANLEQPRDERERMSILVQRFSPAEAEKIVKNPAVDVLLNLDPPLGSIENRHEHTPQHAFETLIGNVQSRRANDPVAALLSLLGLVRKIRNAREHGFKTRSGPRDAVILRAARTILDELCRSALQMKEE
jgi:hypothetical protein